MTRALTGILIGLATACAVGADTVDSSTAVALSERWMSAFATGNAATLAAIYADDARLQYGYCAPVAGRSEIRSFWNMGRIASGVRTRLAILDSFENDDLVYLSGAYTVNDLMDSPPIKGAFTQIWRRSDRSEWSVFRESWVNVACIKVQFRSRPPSADDSVDASATVL